MTPTPTVNLGGIAALAASSPSTPNSTGRPQLSGQQSRSTRPSKERVIGETPMYTRQDREALWTWIVDLLGINQIVKIFGEEMVKDEVLSMWHTEIHRLTTLIFDTLAIEYAKAQTEELEMLRRAAIDQADRQMCHFRSDMIAVAEYRENGVYVNSVEVEERGMSPRVRQGLAQWIVAWGPKITEETAQALVSRSADRRDLQVMYRYMINILWFARVTAEIKLKLAIRAGDDKIKAQALNDLDGTGDLQKALPKFHEGMKRMRELDRTEMEAINASAPRQQRQAAG